MTSNGDVVRAFFQAHAEGRLEDMLALVHPSVLWRPYTPVQRTFYSGHEGTLALFLDLREAFGPFYCHVEETVDVDDVVVHVRGWVQTEGSPDTRGPEFETWITVRDGRLLGQAIEFLDDGPHP